MYERPTSLLRGRVRIDIPIARKNSVLFQAAFTCAPILVAVVSFFIFIISGHEMTVSIAFTVSLCALWLSRPN
jgi:hypothetical protein